MPRRASKQLRRVHHCARCSFRLIGRCPGLRGFNQRVYPPWCYALRCNIPVCVCVAETRVNKRVFSKNVLSNCWNILKYKKQNFLFLCLFFFFVDERILTCWCFDVECVPYTADMELCARRASESSREYSSSAPCLSRAWCVLQQLFARHRLPPGNTVITSPLDFKQENVPG